MKVVFIGECAIDEYYTLDGDRLPRMGGKAPVTAVGVRPGGMVANAAAYFAACGEETYLISSLALDDPHNSLILEDLKSYGVRTAGISCQDHYKNARCLIITSNGERVVYVVAPEPRVPGSSPPTPTLFAKSAEQQQLIGNAAAVYLSLREARQGLIPDDVFEKIRETKSLLFIDCDAHVCAADMAYMEQAGALSINEFGYEDATQKIGEDFKTRLFEKGVRYLLVTRGRKGMELYGREGESHRCDAYNCDEKPVDTTGAGDACNATFLYALLSGMEPLAAIKLASRAGYLATTFTGPRQRSLQSQLKQLINSLNP